MMARVFGPIAAARRSTSTLPVARSTSTKTGIQRFWTIGPAEARRQRRLERRAAAAAGEPEVERSTEQLAQIPGLEDGAAAGDVALACDERLPLALGEERVAEREDLPPQVGRRCHRSSPGLLPGKRAPRSGGYCEPRCRTTVTTPPAGGA